MRTCSCSSARGRGAIRAGGSDWDFGYLSAAGDPHDDLLLRLAFTLGTDDIDLVELSRTGALLPFRAACDGIALFEREPGAFARFQLEALMF